LLLLLLTAFVVSRLLSLLLFSVSFSVLQTCLLSLFAAISSYGPRCLIQMNVFTSSPLRTSCRWSVGIGSPYTSPFALGRARWPGCATDKNS